MRFSFFCISLLGSVMVSPLLQAADLQELFTLAQQRDPVIAQARARFAAQHTQIAQGRSALLPTISLQGTTARNAQAEAAKFSYSDGFNSHGYGLNLNQNLLNFQAWYAYNSVKLADQQALAQLAQSEQQLIMRVSTAYFDALRSQQNLRSFRAEEAAAAQILEQSEQSYSIGLTTVTDVLQSRSNHDLARVSRLLEENTLKQRLEALQLITGQSITSLDDLGEQFTPVPVEPASLPQWEALALEANYALQAADADVAARKADVKTAKAAYLPTIDLSASYNYNAESVNPYSFFNNTASERAVIALNVTVPLYSGGVTRARTRQAYYNRDLAEQGLELTRREVLQNVRNAYRNLETDVITIVAREQALESASSTLESTRTGAQVGTRNIVDVVLAQRTQFQAERDLITARYTYLLNTLNLKLAAGLLSPEDLLELNALLR